MSAPRPSSLFGLLARLASLHRRRLGLLALLVGLGLGASIATSRCAPEPVRVVTYNIEMFPKSDAQVELAFRTLVGIDAPVIAVQEIKDAEALREAVTHELGSRWEVALTDDGLAVGLIVDGQRFRLRSAEQHVIDPKGRGVLEARLSPRKRGPDLRVFVVHLKAGGGSGNSEIRRRQLDALAPIVSRAATAASDEEIIVLGDFNATQDEDRDNLRLFAARTGLTWASEGLECTAYWHRIKSERRSEQEWPELRDCPGSALDHVFTRRAPSSIAARGTCEEVGCDGGLLCPASRFVVSDHCPVVAEL